MNAVATITFVTRNPGFCIKNPRESSVVIKAMNTYRKDHPLCAWCGRPKVDVHHIKPIHLFPELAADPTNFISLNRKPACHHCIGHFGDWKKYNPNVNTICNENKKLLTNVSNIMETDKYEIQQNQPV